MQLVALEFEVEDRSSGWEAALVIATASRMAKRHCGIKRDALVLGGYSALLVAHDRRTLVSIVESEARIVQR